MKSTSQTRERVSGPWRVSMLGGFRLSCGPKGVYVPQNLQRLVAYTALHGGWVTRARAASTLWPDIPEERAASNLRTGLWRLGRIAPLLDAERSSISVADDVEVDIQALTSAAQRVSDGDIALLPQVRCFHAELLPSWYDDWLTLERERLRQLELHMLDAAARSCLDQGRHGDAIDLAHLAIELEPLRESSHRTLIRAYLAGGNRAAALTHFHQLADMLRQELDLAPEDATCALVSSLVGSRTG